MIAALAAELFARPWARTALRRGAVALAVLLFLLSLRRAGERDVHLPFREPEWKLAG